jgi:hypothetical protein
MRGGILDKREKIMSRLFVAALILGVLAVSCRAKPVDEALLPPETPLFLKEGVGYGVVNVSFANVFGGPQDDAASMGLIRRGSIVVVVERRTIPVTGDPNGAARLWAFVEQTARDDFAEMRQVAGWLPGESMDFYTSLSQAETASAMMSR